MSLANTGNIVYGLLAHLVIPGDMNGGGEQLLSTRTCQCAAGIRYKTVCRDQGKVEE